MALRDVPGQPVVGFFSFTAYTLPVGRPVVEVKKSIVGARIVRGPRK